MSGVVQQIKEEAFEKYIKKLLNEELEKQESELKASSGHARPYRYHNVVEEVTQRHIARLKGILVKVEEAVELKK